MERVARIALISEHASPAALLGSEDAGGQNVYVDEISRHLAQIGYPVDVFTRRDSASLDEVVEWAPGVRIVNLEAGPATSLPKDDLWPLMPAFRNAFLEFMLRDGVRYDLLHGNFWMSGWVALELRRRLRLPAVQIFHALGATKRRHQGAADTSPSERTQVEATVAQTVDRVIAHCPTERRELLADYGAPARRITVIPSAVNLERFYPVPLAEARQRLGLPLGEPLIVYVGRVLPRKDIRNVVRALALLVQNGQSARLLVVGGTTRAPDPAATPEIGELQRLAAELGVADRVICTGKRQPDELRADYSAGDVAVTTPWYEPFGFTPLEAMACGRPVIGSAVGGLTYTIQDGVTGYLIPPRDPVALAERLQRLLGQPGLRAVMGQAARARVERQFTWPAVASRIAALYQSLLAMRWRVAPPLTLPRAAPAGDDYGRYVTSYEG